MYLVSGHFHFTPDNVGEAREFMEKIMSLGRTESGNRHYTFYEDPEDALRFFLYEEWDSKGDHDAHFEGAAMQEMVPAFLGLLASPPVVVYYDATVESTL